jgi:hypothetical protein
MPQGVLADDSGPQKLLEIVGAAVNVQPPWERGRLARSSARMAAAPGCGQDARASRGE